MGNLIIKICAGTNKADADYGKEFQLIHVPEFTVINFKQKPYPQMIIDHDEGGTMEVTGNVYVMNNDGKTITTFTPQHQGDDDCIELLNNIDVSQFDFYQDEYHLFYFYSKQHDRLWITDKKFTLLYSATGRVTINPLFDNCFGPVHRVADLLDPNTKLPIGQNGAVYVVGNFNHRTGISLIGIFDNSILELTSGFVDGVWASKHSGLQGVEVTDKTEYPLENAPKIHGMVFKCANKTFMYFEDSSRQSDKFRTICLTAD